MTGRQVAIIQDRTTREWDVCIEQDGLQYVMSTHATPFEAQQQASQYLPLAPDTRGQLVDITV